MVKPSTMATTTSDPTTADSNKHSNISDNIKMYKGVRKRKWGKWVSEIRLPNSRERIWLGSYDTQEKAARAFDAALYCLRGHKASFNFPDTPLNVVVPRDNHSLSHQEIQEVAAKFANDVVAPPQQEPSSSELQCEGKSDESNSLTTTNTSTSSSGFYDCDLQVDGDLLRNADLTFFNTLDDLNGSDFELYSLLSGELMCSAQPPLFFEEGNGDEFEGDDAFSNHSFLWSWNF